MYTDYERVVQVLVEEVAYAKNLKCVMEDPYGNSSEQSIHDISFHILRKNQQYYDFVNSYLSEVSDDCDTTMMIAIRVGNENKVVQTNISLDQPSLHPDALKIIIRSRIHFMINTCVLNFFVTDNKKNKYSVKSKELSEIYLQKIESFSKFKISPKLLEGVSQMSREIYKLKQVTSIATSLNRNETINVVVDSEGRQILESIQNYNLHVTANVCNNQRFMLPVVHNLAFNKISDLPKVIQKMYDYFIEQVNSRSTLGFVESSVYPVLFTHVSTHTLFHEALVGHLFSGDYIVNEFSTIFNDYQDRNLTEIDDKYAVLCDLTILVDPTKAGVYGGYLFDHEGIRSQRTVLCEKGVIKNFLLSRNSAARLARQSNGHARVESYVGLDISGKINSITPEARISHLIINSHKGLADRELVSAIGRYNAKSKQNYNFYLEISSPSGYVDPETSSFTLQFDTCRKVYLDGRVETVNGGTISGTPPDLLASIKAIGHKNHYDIGVCGADSGWVPVSSEAPNLFLTANFIAAAKPKPSTSYDLVRDKYIPNNF